VISRIRVVLDGTSDCDVLERHGVGAVVQAHSVSLAAIYVGRAKVRMACQTPQVKAFGVYWTEVRFAATRQKGQTRPRPRDGVWPGFTRTTLISATRAVERPRPRTRDPILMQASSAPEIRRLGRSSASANGVALSGLAPASPRTSTITAVWCPW